MFNNDDSTTPPEAPMRVIQHTSINHRADASLLKINFAGGLHVALSLHRIMSLEELLGTD
jgi:hypothetical protein